MRKLQVGDKIYVSKEDGAVRDGWAVWEDDPKLGLGFRGSCDLFYDNQDLHELSAWAGIIDGRNSDDDIGDEDCNYWCMAQQLIMEGLI